jgi:hypothetical protein
MDNWGLVDPAARSTISARGAVMQLQAIRYELGEQLEALCNGRAILHGDDSTFDVEEYAGAGLCTLSRSEKTFALRDVACGGSEYPLSETIQAGWYDVEWQGHSFEIVWITITESYCPHRYHWLIGDSKERAEAFFVAVVDWNTELRDEVYYFDGGHWHKSRQLYHSIKKATFDGLVLPPALKREIIDDFTQFFASRDVYEKYRLPWKRGVLMIGPPGNGKTHTVKALINRLGVDCLYVKSFKAARSTDQASISEVFRHARQMTPCILVLEDLDSLITDQNRSYFLNEVDGFMQNNGILVLATTNHPERLDAAILERPSRFDRKYYFELPAPEEREAYLRSWNETVEPELRLSQDGIISITAQTDGFSFAYLKELWLSSMMRWINSGGPGGSSPAVMDDGMAAQVDILREQMTAARDAHPQAADTPAVAEDEAVDYDED